MLYECLRVCLAILQGLYGALRVLVCVFAHFTRALRSSTGAYLRFGHFTRALLSSTGAYVRFGQFTKLLRSSTGARVCVFVHFTRTLRSSTGAYACLGHFRSPAWGISSGFSAGVCLSFGYFTRTLRSSIGARVRFRAFHKDSTELQGCSCAFS